MSSLLPESEYIRYRTIVYNGITNHDLLTPFDLSFLRDYENRFDTYKRHAFVSDKQHEQFDRIEEYLKEGLGHSYEELK